jgi:hypothetical protein
LGGQKKDLNIKSKIKKDFASEKKEKSFKKEEMRALA